jgi:hypothetical protein
VIHKKILEGSKSRIHKAARRQCGRICRHWSRRPRSISSGSDAAQSVLSILFQDRVGDLEDLLVVLERLNRNLCAQSLTLLHLGIAHSVATAPYVGRKHRKLHRSICA